MTCPPSRVRFTPWWGSNLFVIPRNEGSSGDPIKEPITEDPSFLGMTKASRWQKRNDKKAKRKKWLEMRKNVAL